MSGGDNVRTGTILFALALLLAVAISCAAAPTPVDADRVQSIIVYSDGEATTLGPGDTGFASLTEHLLSLASRFNLPAGCRFDESKIAALKRQDRLLHLTFRQRESITLGERIPREERSRISTDGMGFRVVDADSILFALSGEYRGHLLLTAEGEPDAWSCWAIEREGEIDTRWIERVEQILTR